MYAQYSLIVKNSTRGLKHSEMQFQLKQYHHVRLNQEFKLNCSIWLSLLMDVSLSRLINRPMVDIDAVTNATEIGYFSDASAAEEKGYGCVFGNYWLFGQ